MSKEAAGQAFEQDNGPLRALEECLYGGVPEANMLSKLLHLHRSDPYSVLAALSERANATVANADSGLAAAQKAGATLVSAARFLDERCAEEETKSEAMIVEVKQEEGEAEKKVEKKPELPLHGAGVCKALLEHVLHLTGTSTRAAKDKSVRAMGCTMVAALSEHVPHHRGAEAKLLEFALDKVPAIRERAVRGLSNFAGSLLTDKALVNRATDPCTAVRASAMRALQPSRATAPALLGRLDDAEPVVRMQLFHRLAERPSAAEDLGPAVLVRLVVGLKDRSAVVRVAAGGAVDAWRTHFGGALALLARCDVLSDETLGEAAAAALAGRYVAEGRVQAKKLLGAGPAGGAAAKPCDNGTGPAGPLLARVAAALMQDEDRDEVVDVPSLVERTKEVLREAECQETGLPWSGFALRQLLHVLVGVDISILDEATRKEMEYLAEAVLQRAPLTASSGGNRAHGAVDLGVALLRKCCGLGHGIMRRSGRVQSLEARCSSQVVLLVSEFCESAGTCAGGGEDAVDGAEGGQFTVQLSIKLQDLNAAVEERQALKTTLAARKDKAVADEEFIEAQKLKEAMKRNASELSGLEQERDRLQKERDGVCLRVLAILNALLRWTSSDLRRDPALHGALDQILVPMMGLPALSEEVELAAITAICLFSERDGALATRHWGLMLELLRGLRQGADARAQPVTQHTRARAGIAARALADCARLHGVEGGYMDRDEVMSAGCALAAVPFAARQVTVEPLCGWLLNLGHLFFEEHLREPVLEVQWALGWMLVEVFTRPNLGMEDDAAQDGASTAKVEHKVMEVKDEPGVEKKELAAPAGPAEAGPEPGSLSARLAQFFAVLPKLPGKHGAPLLSLAAEAVAESGLWRRAALLPKEEAGARTRWERGFSWPQLFDFAHQRLPADMRLRLWRSSLQLCVAEPALSALAEVPFALAAAAADAPAGATDVLHEAIALGADPVALAPVAKALGGAPRGGVQQALLTQAEAKAAEAQRRAALEELGIEVESWAPAHVPVPDAAPPQHRARIARGISRSGSSGELRQAASGPLKRGISAAAPEEAQGDAAPAVVEVEERINAAATPLFANKRRRKIDWAAKEALGQPTSDAVAA